VHFLHSALKNGQQKTTVRVHRGWITDLVPKTTV